MIGQEHDSDTAPDDWRQALLAEFEAWVREAPEPPVAAAVAPATGREAAEREAAVDPDEPDRSGSAQPQLPQAGPPEPPGRPDLYSFYAELAALKQEVRMQGRAAHGAARAAETSAETLNEALAVRESELGGVAESLKSMIPAARREARAQVLTELVRVRESLGRLHEAAGAGALPNRPWLKAAREQIEQTTRSVRLVLAEADDALRRLNVMPVAAVGEAFDPRTMRAAGRSEQGVPGTVTTVLRQGYRTGDGLLQLAEVIVAAGDGSVAPEEMAGRAQPSAEEAP